MTRKRLNRILRRTYWILALVLLLSLAAKFVDHAPGLKATVVSAIAKDFYEYLKDMALVFVTVVAAYLANVFQKRSKFVENLEKEWRSIVQTKSALFTYCAKPYPTTEEYVQAFCSISETLDNIRIIYSNVGETDRLIGLYPYAPLHDMRRALQTLDPRKRNNIGDEQRSLARHAILQSFYALRENFLEELDLQEPDHPLLISGARRLKKSGALEDAKAWQERQSRLQSKETVGDAEIDAFLQQQYDKEKASESEKVWRHPGTPDRIMAAAANKP